MSHSLRFAVLSLLLAAVAANAAPLKTERVILITADGLRNQELFTGADPTLMEVAADKDKAIAKKVGIDDIGKFRLDYWRDTPDERRNVTFPFFWGTLAKQGIVLGNPEKNSHVLVTNNNRISYPGYAEILTGKPQPKIWTNLEVPSPQTTVLEFAQQKLGLDQYGVAAFGSWKNVNLMSARESTAFFINAGYEAMPAELLTPGMEPLNTLQFEMMTPFDSVRHDNVTVQLALEYLKSRQPKLMYLSLGETDDWAHACRYDRVLHACHLFDAALQTLWETLQSLDAYREKTTLVITTDHGRGITADDWNGHGKEIPGSENIWMVIIGPDTPDVGEMENTSNTQSQAAATVAKFLGLDFVADFPESAQPVAEAFGE